MARRKTHEKYVEEVAIKNKNIEVVGQYANAETKILHMCLIDGYEWYAKPANILSGKGCPKCAGNLQLTTSEYLSRLSVVNPNIEAIEDYVTAKTKILHKCKIDGYEWYVEPSSTLQGCGCPQCAGNIKRSHEEYVVELLTKNPNVESIDVYVNANTPILHRCILHDVYWYITPYNALLGRGCVKCSHEKTRLSIMKTQEEYEAELCIKNPHVKLVGKYINARTPTTHRCNEHNMLWDVLPHSVLLGNGCSKCWRERAAIALRKTEVQYVAELEQLNSSVELVGDYINSNTPTLHHCKACDNYWSPTPGNVLAGHGCPICNQSYGEKVVGIWLAKHNISFISQHRFADCIDQRQLPFDFYLPELNKMIEFDGEQHFRPVDFAGRGAKWALEHFKITQHHDKIKNQYCCDNNIQLLRIPYFKNIEDELNNFLFI